MIDFQVTEAVVLKVAEEEREERESEEREAEKKSPEGLHGHRSDDFLSRARAAEASG